MDRPTLGYDLAVASGDRRSPYAALARCASGPVRVDGQVTDKSKVASGIEALAPATRNATNLPRLGALSRSS